MEEIQTVLDGGLPATPVAEAQASSAEGKPGGSQKASSSVGGDKGTQAQNVSEEEGGGTPAPEAGEVSQHPDFLKATKERDDALSKIQEFESRLAAQNEQLVQFQRSMIEATRGGQERARETPPQRNFDAELQAIDKQLEEGDISLVEANVKQREILREQSKIEAQAYYQEMMKGQNVSALQQAFLKDNPDYLTFVQSGKVKEIQGKAPWGGLHDDVSAFFAHKLEETLASKEKEIQSAVEKAVKETEKKVLEQVKAKGRAATLGQGPTSVPPQGQETDPRLKEPKKHGGVTSVIAARLAERRAQRG